VSPLGDKNNFKTIPLGHAHLEKRQDSESSKDEIMKEELNSKKEETDTKSK